MKVEIKVSNKEVFGIELIAETTDEYGILKRFLDKGIKINGHSPNSLQLTFRDLMTKDSAVIMLLEEALENAIRANPNRYQELVDICQKLLSYDFPQALMSIDKDERLTEFEKIYVAHCVGFNRCNNELWPLFKKQAIDNEKKGDKK